MDNKELAEQLVKIAKEIRAKKNFTKFGKEKVLKSIQEAQKDWDKIVNEVDKYSAVPKEVTSEVNGVVAGLGALVYYLRKM